MEIDFVKVEPENLSVLDFSSYLDSLESPSPNVEHAAQSQADLFHVALREIEAKGRQRGATIWAVIDTYPSMIQNVARIMSCLPTTQVSVERVFSQLKLILRDNRSNLGSEVVDALLFLRLNDCL